MQDGPTISNLPEGHNLTTSSVVINVPAAVVSPGSPLVKVLIKYPTDWTKDKFFKDGDIKAVSPESAATFVEIGIATMFDDTKVDDGDELGNDGKQPPVTPELPSVDELPAIEEKKGTSKKGK